MARPGEASPRAREFLSSTSIRHSEGFGVPDPSLSPTRDVTPPSAVEARESSAGTSADIIAGNGRAGVGPLVADERLRLLRPPAAEVRHAVATLANSLKELVRRMEAVLKLKADWDTYSAPPINRATTDAAFFSMLALASRCPDSPPPQVVPTSAGGIQLEWHEKGVHLELEFQLNGEVAVYLRRAGVQRETVSTQNEIAGMPEVQDVMKDLQR